jgi:hypothetical protein
MGELVADKHAPCGLQACPVMAPIRVTSHGLFEPPHGRIAENHESELAHRHCGGFGIVRVRGPLIRRLWQSAAVETRISGNRWPEVAICRRVPGSFGIPVLLASGSVSETKGAFPNLYRFNTSWKRDAPQDYHPLSTALKEMAPCLSTVTSLFPNIRVYNCIGSCLRLHL